jgi:hypothetical protein
MWSVPSSSPDPGQAGRSAFRGDIGTATVRLVYLSTSGRQTRDVGIGTAIEALIQSARMGMRATTIRFSEDLWELLEREAQRQGVSAAQFLRESALLRLGAASARGDAPASPADGSADVSRQLADGARLVALRTTGLLDSPPAPAFDRLTRLASRFLNAPVVLVSLIDADRQYFKSCLGLPEPWASRRETPLSHSFCQYVVARREPLIVSDAREHPELRENLAIRDLNVIAYAGVPLIDRAGHALGSLCAIDGEPRLWSGQQIDTLRDLAETAVAAIELESTRSQRSAPAHGRSGSRRADAKAE